jgi:hypothetical protein
MKCFSQGKLRSSPSSEIWYPDLRYKDSKISEKRVIFIPSSTLKIGAARYPTTASAQKPATTTKLPAFQKPRRLL